MPHTWKFFRAGGFDQVKLETGADLTNLDQLDQKLWIVLARPACRDSALNAGVRAWMICACHA